MRCATPTTSASWTRSPPSPARAGLGWGHGGVAVDGQDPHRPGPRRRHGGVGARGPGRLAGALRPYDQIITAGRAANPPPQPRPSGRRAKRSAALCLLDRLDRYRDQVTRFLVDLRVPFDNNQAERDLRMVKLQHKISGAWRTMAGAETFCRLRSSIATARKHGHNPLAVLCELFNGRPWLPTPATT
jgi:transposase